MNYRAGVVFVCNSVNMTEWEYFIIKFARVSMGEGEIVEKLKGSRGMMNHE